MIKLVNFLKINFILIFVCFFLPFAPFYSCESEKTKTSTIDSTTTTTTTTTTTIVDSINTNASSVSKAQIDSSISDTVSNKTDSLLNNQNVKDSQKSGIINFLSFTKYKTVESDLSITGFGGVVLSAHSVFEGNFNVFYWGSYPVPISYIACILGLLGSIKSRRRKHQFLFICSLSGLVAISIIGFSVGNLSDLLFGFWTVAVLYLINTLLSFILWRNYFPLKVSNE